MTKERSVLVDTLLDAFGRTKERKVARREREVEAAQERMEVTLSNGQKVICGRSV